MIICVCRDMVERGRQGEGTSSGRKGCSARQVAPGASTSDSRVASFSRPLLPTSLLGTQ